MKPSKLNLISLTALALVLTACSRDTDITNVVPVANAGPSQTVTLPFSSITLTGTGSDQDGQVVAFLWSQVSGPGSTVITNPGSASTTVTGFVAGNYVFQLMVTDNDGATGVDTVSIKVNPNPQVTLTLQPANNPNDFVLGLVAGANQSSNSWIDIPVSSWTTGGQPVTLRSLLKFDLSTIPQSATIVSANLYLYSYPAPIPDGNFTDANFGSNNTLLIQRVTTNWSPATTTWANQPAGTTTNQIIVPHTASSMLDLNVDVTGLVTTMVNTNANYGFLMQLQNEVTYTSRIFVSSHNTVHTTKYPKLVVVYRP